MQVYRRVVIANIFLRYPNVLDISSWNGKILNPNQMDIYPSFNQQTTVSLPINDKFINAGEYINININPGTDCVNRIVGIYDDSGFRRATVQPPSSQYGSNKKICQQATVRFKTYPAWAPSDEDSRIFFIKVFDYGAEDYVSTTFTIN